MCDMRHDARLDLRLPRPCAREKAAGSGAEMMEGRLDDPSPAAPKKAPPVGEAGPVTWGAERRGPPPATHAIQSAGHGSPDCHQKFWMCLSSNGANRTAYRGFACTGRCRSALVRLKVVPPRSRAATSKTLMTRRRLVLRSARYAEQAISARCRGIGGSTASVCRERASSRTTGQIALSAWTAKRCKLRGCRGISADAALTFCAPADARLRSSMLPVVGCGGAGIAMISVMRAARPRRITVNSSRRRRSGSGWPAVEICWSNFRRSQRECTGGCARSSRQLQLRRVGRILPRAEGAHPTGCALAPSVKRQFTKCCWWASWGIEAPSRDVPIK
jgi:hypothetical protein